MAGAIERREMLGIQEGIKHIEHFMMIEQIAGTSPGGLKLMSQLTLARQALAALQGLAAATEM